MFRTGAGQARGLSWFRNMSDQLKARYVSGMAGQAMTRSGQVSCWAEQDKRMPRRGQIRDIPG